MICQNCHKKEASVFYKETVNGKHTSYALCSDCAKELKTGGIHEHFGFSAFPLTDAGLLGSIFGESRAVPSKRCPLCSMTFAEISKSGKVGCAECYRTFKAELRSSITRIHGATTHTGKRYQKAKIEGTAKSKEPEVQGAPLMEELRERLAKAIEAEAFEEAAKIRDEINARRSKGENDGMV